jgi:hypothetical protein
MIKVFLKNGKVITFELGNEKKELEIVSRFHNGLDGNTVLNLKTSSERVASRIKVSDIKNMQCLKDEKNKPAKTGESIPDTSAQTAKFKTRAEYDKWKEQKIRENELNSAKAQSAKNSRTRQ